MKSRGSWSKHTGKREVAEIADWVKDADIPNKITFELDPRQCRLLFSCMRTQCYKLNKEDKPFIPEPGKTNANHTRQTGLVEIAQQIQSAIKANSDRNKQQSAINNNASRGSSEAIQLPGDDTIAVTFSSGSQGSGDSRSGSSQQERSVAQPLEQAAPNTGD